MALLCSKHVLRLSRSLAVKPLSWKLDHAVINKQMTRLLFSDTLLGLDGHRRQRATNLDRLGSLKAKFQSRMEDYMNAAEKNTIFTDDLKTIWSVAESDVELATATRMLKRFNTQNTTMTFSNFAFGPVVMRTFHLLKKPDEAYKLFTDEEFSNLMHSHMATFILLMDLLFESGQYQRVLEINQLLGQKQPLGVKVSYDASTLAVAACCKLDSNECLDAMMEILTACSRERALSARTVTIGTKLALQQNKPEVAMEILAMREFTQTNRVPVDYINIKIQTYLRLGRLEDAIQLLSTQIDAPLGGRQPADAKLVGSIFTSVLEEVRALTQESGDSDLKERFEHVERSLEEGGRLRDQDFNDFPFRPIIRNRQMKGSYKSARMGVRLPHRESLTLSDNR